MNETVKIIAYCDNKIISSKQISLYEYYDGDNLPEIDDNNFIKDNKINIVEVCMPDNVVHKNYYNESGSPVKFETYENNVLIESSLA